MERDQPFCYFTDHTDPVLAAAVRAGRRREFEAFGWVPENVPDPQAADTFARSKLRWDELGEPDHARLRAWYRALIRLRAVEPSLTSSERPEVQIDPVASRLVTIRRGALNVHANCGAKAAALSIGAARLLLGSPGAEVSGDVLHLPAWGVGVLRLSGRGAAPASARAPAQPASVSGA
jgi:maltooligosyltrehalose trehalohydrolase